MKVVATGSKPPIIMDTQNSQAQADAKARAVAKLTGSPAPTQVQTTPVQNANAVRAEEIPAIQTRKPTSEAPQQLSSEETTSQTTETTQETPPDAQLQALIRREKALRQAAHKQEQAFKTKEEALAKRQAELDAKAKELEQGYIPRNRLKQSPLEVLAEEDISYDDIAALQLEAQQVNPQIKALITKMQRQIEELKQGNDDLKKSQETQTQESTEAARRVIRRDINSIVQGDTTGEYDFIKAHGKTATEAVLRLIESEFNETGNMMSVEDAMTEVENEYLERFEKQQKLSKVQKRLQEKANTSQSTVQEQTPAPTKQPQPMKTLTNANASSRPLSAKERAILAFEGKLKS